MEKFYWLWQHREQLQLQQDRVNWAMKKGEEGWRWQGLALGPRLLAAKQGRGKLDRLFFVMFVLLILFLYF